MKLYDRETGTVIANVCANYSMSIDDVLDIMRYSVRDDGQIYDDDNEQYLDAWYDSLEEVVEE